MVTVGTLVGSGISPSPSAAGGASPEVIDSGTSAISAGAVPTSAAGSGFAATTAPAGAGAAGVLAATSRISLKPCFSSSALVAVVKRPPVRSAAQLRAFTDSDGSLSKPITLMRKPGFASFSVLETAQTSASQ